MCGWKGGAEYGTSEEELEGVCTVEAPYPLIGICGLSMVYCGPKVSLNFA